MCGRSRCSLGHQQVARAAGVPEERWVGREQYAPSNNVYPSCSTPVMVMNEGTRQLRTMKWGLVPSFTKKGEKLDHWKMFNARSETVDTKSVFKRLLSRRRCVVVIDGFYEWKKDGNKKQPYYISLGQGQPMMLAGLYDEYHGEAEKEPLYTYTILTVDSSSKLSWLHNRMPAILRTPEQVDAWLGGSTAVLEDATPPQVLSGKVIAPYSGPDLQWHPVTSKMSNHHYDAPDCATDVRGAVGAISSFFKPGTASKGHSGKGEKRAREDAAEHGVDMVKAEALSGCSPTTNSDESSECSSRQVCGAKQRTLKPGAEEQMPHSPCYHDGDKIEVGRFGVETGADVKNNKAVTSQAEVKAEGGGSDEPSVTHQPAHRGGLEMEGVLIGVNADPKCDRDNVEMEEYLAQRCHANQIAGLKDNIVASITADSNQEKAAVGRAVQLPSDHQTCDKSLYKTRTRHGAASQTAASAAPKVPGKAGHNTACGAVGGSPRTLKKGTIESFFAPTSHAVKK